MSRVSFALVLATAAVAATPSLGADLYGAPPAQPSYGTTLPAPGINWTGGYAGGQAGYAWGDDHNDGGNFGVYGGYNTHVGANVVGGVEGDFNLSGQEARKTPAAGLTYHGRSDWNASLRARVGIAVDRFLPYATAGLALADDTVKGMGQKDSQTKVGYALGAGVEAQVVDKVTVKGELMREGFGSTNHMLGTRKVNNTVSTTVLRAGVAYHF